LQSSRAAWPRAGVEAGLGGTLKLFPVVGSGQGPDAAELRAQGCLCPVPWATILPCLDGMEGRVSSSPLGRRESGQVVKTTTHTCTHIHTFTHMHNYTVTCMFTHNI
jgi:hypothetical protein